MFRTLLEKLRFVFTGVIQARSVDQFVSLVKESGCTKIFIVPVMRQEVNGSTYDGEIAGIYGYWFEFLCLVPEKLKTIRYLEKNLQQEHVGGILQRGKTRGEAAVIHLLMIERRRNEIRSLLPSIQIVVGRPDGKVLTEADFQRLHRDAEQGGVSIAALSS